MSESSTPRRPPAFLQLKGASISRYVPFDVVINDRWRSEASAAEGRDEATVRPASVPEEFRSLESWPMRLDGIVCRNCQFNLEGLRPKPIPRYAQLDDDDSSCFGVEGVACSFACAARYIATRYGVEGQARQGTLLLIYQIFTGMSVARITMAPDPCTMVHHGGKLSIAEYRQAVDEAEAKTAAASAPWPQSVNTSRRATAAANALWLVYDETYGAEPPDAARLDSGLDTTDGMSAQMSSLLDELLGGDDVVADINTADVSAASASAASASMVSTPAADAPVASTPIASAPAAGTPAASVPTSAPATSVPTSAPATSVPTSAPAMGAPATAPVATAPVVGASAKPKRKVGHKVAAKQVTKAPNKTTDVTPDVTPDKVVLAAADDVLDSLFEG